MAMSEQGQQGSFGIDAMLERARQLYASHFWDTQRSHSPLAQSVDKLRQSLRRLKDNKLAVRADTREETFVRLTEGLLETIDEVNDKFGHNFAANNPNRDSQTGAESFSWIQECQKRMSYFATTVDIIFEALEIAQAPHSLRLPRVSSFEPGKHFDTAETLSGLLRNFLSGFPESHNRHSGGSQYQLKPLLYSRSESADYMEKTLEFRTKQAMDGALSEEESCFWRVRHAIYWYSIGQESLNAITNSKRPQNQLHMELIARSYLDAIKSAWLLKWTMLSPSFDHMNALARSISLLLEDNILQLLQSYSDFFDVPDYELIIQEADFRIMMTPRRAASFDTPKPKGGPTAPIALEPSRPRERVQLHTELGDSASQRLQGQNFAPDITESPISQFASTGFIDFATSLNAYKIQQHRRKEPQRLPRAGSGFSRLPGSSSDLARMGDPPPVARTYTEPTMNDGVTRMSAQSPPVPPKLPRTAFTDSGTRERHREAIGIARQYPRQRMESNTYELDAPVMHARATADDVVGVPPSDLDPMLSALHVSRLEQDITVQRIEELVAADGEREVENAESSKAGGFQRLFCAERAQRDGGNYVPARVRMFKDESTRTLRLWTSCPDQPLQESTVNLTFDKIVPLYAWTDNSHAGAEIYLRHRGQQLGFCYKFDVHNGETELYGFQGALMESYFEGEYRVSSVSLNFYRKASAIEASNPKVQMWTEMDDPTNTAKITAALSSQQKRAGSFQADKDFFLKLDDLLSKVSCSKILVFSSMSIIVLLITDLTRLEVEKPSSYRFGHKPTLPRARLVPNKDRGCTTVRALILPREAGIPLGHNGMRYADIGGPKFEDCSNVVFEFHTADSHRGFVNLHDELVDGWQTRREPLDRFRALQRNRTVTVSSNTKYD